MSEFQYVGFRAIDAPLDDDQLHYMESQSSRGEITRWSFKNTYHYGDFRGNAVEMLRRGYDLHLHYANFGIRKVMIRLPQGLPTPKARCAKYLDGENVVWQADAKGPAGILTISASTDSGVLDELWGVEEYLDTRIMPQRKKKTTSVPKTTISADRLARALARRRKAELIEIIVDIARADRGILRQLEMKFSVEVLPKELVAETRQAIGDATEFDEREINYNFDYGLFRDRAFAVWSTATCA